MIVIWEFEYCRGRGVIHCQMICHNKRKSHTPKTLQYKLVLIQGIITDSVVLAVMILITIIIQPTAYSMLVRSSGEVAKTLVLRKICTVHIILKTRLSCVGSGTVTMQMICGFAIHLHSRAIQMQSPDCPAEFCCTYNQSIMSPKKQL